MTEGGPLMDQTSEEVRAAASVIETVGILTGQNRRSTELLVGANVAAGNVRKLHARSGGDEGDVCQTCGVLYPCPTRVENDKLRPDPMDTMALGVLPEMSVVQASTGAALQRTAAGWVSPGTVRPWSATELIGAEPYRLLAVGAGWWG